MAVQPPVRLSYTEAMTKLFKETPITGTLLAICLTLFIPAGVLSGSWAWFDANVLVALGANYGPYVVQGEWWRLLTSMFLHGGLIHLLFNSLILWQIGRLLETMLGKTTLLLVFILTGIAGSITSIIFNYGVVSVGASGAIFGLFGYYAIFLLHPMIPRHVARPLLKSTGLFVGLNLLIGLIGPIDNAAHIGGLAAGLLLGGLSYPIMGKLVMRKKRQLQALQAGSSDPEQVDD